MNKLPENITKLIADTAKKEFPPQWHGGVDVEKDARFGYRYGAKEVLENPQKYNLVPLSLVEGLVEQLEVYGGLTYKGHGDCGYYVNKKGDTFASISNWKLNEAAKALADFEAWKAKGGENG